MDRKTHTHKHTLKTNSLTWRLEPRSHKGQLVTSKADRQTSKEHPESTMEKPVKKKRNNAKMDPYHAMHHAAPS